MTTEQLVVGFGERRYRLHRPWGTMPDQVKLAGLSKGAVDSEGCLYICQRTNPPIIVLDPNGKFLRSFGDGMIVDSHGIFITDDDRVLVVDRDGHQVIGFDKQGKPLFTLGDREHPKYQAPFNHPTDIAVGSNGTMYVSDGYGNSCVHQFSADGDLIRSWGGLGRGPGEFMVPHGIGVLPDGRVIVSDRENNRIQVFDSEGSYLTEWGNFHKPMDIFVDHDLVYVSDQIPRVTALRHDGTIVGTCKPVPVRPHGVRGDKDGNIYFIEATTSTITKIVPIP
ncbi:MAG: peptidyl-alpha-hydroxyglycine alpha-amidating lyase family protein [Rhodospirillales bacterium]|nr:peptidyl-alpha-hydroxyglycine alpha-amidating lyase family protein [Rhodospirillales bacterium]